MSGCYPCLPENIKEDSVASVITETSAAGVVSTKKITVKETLKNLKATCRNGELVDKDNRPIRFYTLQGCWGNPPADYLEILDNQRRKIERLKKDYTVIEMTCNPGGVPPQSIL